nr:hypothetical protein [Tanacetum cinerariifolium]
PGSRQPYVELSLMIGSMCVAIGLLSRTSAHSSNFDAYFLCDITRPEEFLMNSMPRVYWKYLRFVGIDLVMVDCLVGGRGGGDGMGEGVESCDSVALLLGDGEVMDVWIGEFEGVVGEEVVIIEENCNGEVKGSVRRWV